MSKTKYLFGAALVVALVAGPTAAYATVEPNTTETEVTSSTSGPAISGIEATLTEPTTAEAIPTTPILVTTPTPAAETATPTAKSPAVTPPATGSVATSPTTVAPVSSASTPPTTSPKYVLAIWENVAGSPKFPQKLISSTATNSNDVTSALKAAATKCGTFYQSDLYANDAATAKLIAKGVLNGGDESWPKGEPQRYHTITTPACKSVPQIQDYVKCEGAAFVLDNIGSNQDVRYLLSGEVKREFVVPGGTAIHTDSDGWLLKPGPQGYVITAADRTWTFPAATCPVITPPTPPVKEEPSSHDTPTTPAPPTTPGPSAGPTSPEKTPGPQTSPGNGSVTPSTVKTDAPSLRTALKATGTTTDLVGAQPVTSSSPQKLAMTGSDDWKIGIVIAVIMIAVGAFAVRDVRSYKRFVKFHPNNKDKQQ